MVFLAVLVVAVSLTGCGGKEEQGKRALQTAAKVNDEEITVHQINHLLQRQHGLKTEQSEAAGRQILDRLIDQELAVQKAKELKLHRDSQVVQQIEAARRSSPGRISNGSATPPQSRRLPT